MNEVVILVLTCNKYSDLWDGFFFQFKECFPLDRKIYFATNHIQNKFPEMEIIEFGEEKNWSNTLLKILNKINENKIFIILEDIYLTSNLNINEFIKIEQFIIKNDVQHFKYFANPPGNIMEDSGYLRYEKGMPYMVSLCGIWDKVYLKSLLLDGESPWQFEVNGSYRASFSGSRFYSTKKTLMSYRNMVEKGKFVGKNYKWARSNNLLVIGNRDVKNSTAYHLINAIYNIILNISWKKRLTVINFLKKVLIVY